MIAGLIIWNPHVWHQNTHLFYWGAAIQIPVIHTTNSINSTWNPTKMPFVRRNSPSKPHQIWVPCNKSHPSPSHSASSSSPALAQHFLKWLARITNRSGMWACLRMGYLPKMSMLIGILMLNYQNWRCPIILRQTHFGWGSGIFN